MLREFPPHDYFLLDVQLAFSLSLYICPPNNPHFGGVTFFDRAQSIRTAPMKPPVRRVLNRIANLGFIPKVASGTASRLAENLTFATSTLADSDCRVKSILGGLLRMLGGN